MSLISRAGTYLRLFNIPTTMQTSMASGHLGCSLKMTAMVRSNQRASELISSTFRLARGSQSRMLVHDTQLRRHACALQTAPLHFPHPTHPSRPMMGDSHTWRLSRHVASAAHSSSQSPSLPVQGALCSRPSPQPSTTLRPLEQPLQSLVQWEALRRKCVASLLALALAMTALLSPSAAFAEPDRGGIFGGFFNQSPTAPTATVTMENKEPFPSASDLSSEELATVKLFQDNTPSVVNIANIATARSYFSTDVMRIPQGQGSGFVWDDKGHVVTNFHVIRGAYEVQVALIDQSVFKAKIIGGDPSKDIAVLQLQAPPSVLKNLKPIVQGQSSGLFVGQKVYAIGNPFGLDHTLTSGIISGLNRELASGMGAGPSLRNMVQTDASINPGNSGGPLLDSKGRLIGINTAIADPTGRGASSGVGFAIPIDQVKGLVEQILTYGRVMRPVLGVTIAPQQAVRQLDIQGVLVLGVPPGTPAAKAGLQGTYRDEFGRLVLGDVIVGLNGAPIKSEKDLYNLLDSCKVGDSVKVDVLRKGNQRQTISVTLAERAPDVAE